MAIRQQNAHPANQQPSRSYPTKIYTKKLSPDERELTNYLEKVRKIDKTERSTEIGRRTRGDTGMGNQKTALRLQTGITHTHTSHTPDPFFFSYRWWWELITKVLIRKKE